MIVSLLNIENRCRQFTVALSIVVCCSTSVSCQRKLPEDAISLSETSKQIHFLASDELMGRLTGTPGNDGAAQFISEQFRSFGVEPLPGAPNYFQEIEFERMSPARDGQLILLGDTLWHPESMFVRYGRSTNLSAPAVYANYGVFEPDSARDDYQGIDVRGKIVVVKFGSPTDDEVFKGLWAGSAKRAAAAKHGAAALIELYSGSTPMSSLAFLLNEQSFSLASDSINGAEPLFPHAVVRDSTGELEKRIAQQKGLMATFRTQGATIEKVVSRNVVGFIRGRDVALQKEFICLTAHYDHVGVRSAGGRAIPDSIYNGARDNAIWAIG